MRQVTLIAIKSLIVLALGFTIALVLIVLLPHIQTVGNVLNRPRSSLCTLAQAFRDSEDRSRSQLRRLRIFQRMAPISGDADSIQWSLDGVSIWQPAGNSGARLATLLAEQQEGLYEPARPGDVVLDCGAHVGVYTRQALKQGAQVVVAIEPMPVTLKCLNRNLAGEIATGRVVVYPKGVWNKEDVLHMSVQPDNAARSTLVLNRPNAGPSIPLTTIDQIVRELHLTRVDVIKMDIEGSERQALGGARETIRRFHPRMSIASYHLPDDPEVIRSLVSSITSEYRLKCLSCGVYGEHGGIVPGTMLFE